MNILYISELPNLGGGETSLLNTLIEFKKSKYGIRCFLMCFEEGKLSEEARKNGINVIIYNLKKQIKNGKLIDVFNSIHNILKENLIEIVQSNEWWTSIAVGFISRSYFLKCRTIWMCHGQWYKFNYAKRLMINLFVNNIIAVSKAVEKNLYLNNIKNKKIYQIYLGVDIEKFAEGNSEKIRNEFQISLDTKLFAVIGRFQEIKGQDLVVNAIKELENDNLKYKIMFVGDSIFNYKKDDLYKKNILNYVNENNLNDKVIFTGVRTDISDILHGIDGLIVPSINESLGMVVLEAFAAGCLVISTPCDGPSETIDNMKTGILLRDRSVKSLVSVLRKYFNNEINIDKIKENERIEIKKYGIEKICDKYMEVYNRHFL